MSSFESFMESDTFLSYEEKLGKEDKEVLSAVRERRKKETVMEKKEYVMEWLKSNAEVWKESNLRQLHQQRVLERNQSRERVALELSPSCSTTKKRESKSKIGKVTEENISDMEASSSKGQKETSARPKRSTNKASSSRRK